MAAQTLAGGAEARDRRGDVCDRGICFGRGTPVRRQREPALHVAAARSGCDRTDRCSTFPLDAGTGARDDYAGARDGAWHADIDEYIAHYRDRSFGRLPHPRWLGLRRPGTQTHSRCAEAATIPSPSGVRVWLATDKTDMRPGINGLSLQVHETLGRDPFSGDLSSATLWAMCGRLRVVKEFERDSAWSWQPCVRPFSAALTWPLALMPSADRVPVKSSHSRCHGPFGLSRSPVRPVLHNVLSALSNRYFTRLGA